MRLDLTGLLYHIRAVKKIFSYRWLVSAFIALFFALQSYSISHASNYSDAPHEHDGIACSVTVLADDQMVIMPTAPILGSIEVELSETVYPDFTSALYIRPQGRAPPPRGPPASI
jgi:hypothetical protein